MPVRVRLRALVGLRRWLIGAVIFLGLLVVAFFVGLRIFLATESGSRWVRFWVVEILSAALRTDVRLGRVRMEGVATLEIQNLSIDDQQCAPLLRAPRIRLQWLPGLFWQGFWKGKLFIPLSTIEIESPFVYLYHERRSGLLNLDRLFPPDTTPSDHKSSPFSLRLPHLLLRNGTFIFRDSTFHDTALLVRRGFMNYANLYLSRLQLSASIEKYGDRLFVYVHHLSVVDSGAQAGVDTLRMVLRAYSDSTVIDYLFLRTGGSRLNVWGKFLREGLDKLFLNTDTKQFVAVLRGVIDWRDIGVFSGEELPLRGRWQVAAEVGGDLAKLRWRRLSIETAEGLRLETAGEIWHYARPRFLYWDVRVKEGWITLSGIGAALPEVAGWPKNWDTLRLWPVSGRSIGSLHSYWFQFQLPKAQVLYTMERVGSEWAWQGAARLSGWSLSDLMRDIPVQALHGEVRIEGRGFDWKKWTGLLQASLSGIYDTISVQQLTISAEADGGQWNGYLSLRSPLVSAALGGALRLAEAPALQVRGELHALSAKWWGGEGTLTGHIQTNMEASSWEKLHGEVSLSHLIWQRPDTVLSLGDLRAEVVGEGPMQVRLLSNYVAARATLHADWGEFAEVIQEIVTGVEAWALKQKPPVIGEAVRIVPLEAELTLREGGAWAWMHLLGLPQEVRGGSAKAYLSWDNTSWQLRTEIDSLIFAAGDLQGITLEAEGRWQGLWPFTATLKIGYGEAFLRFRDFHGQIMGSYPGGQVQVGLSVGAYDTLYFQGQWRWPGGAEFSFELNPNISFFTLGRQRWVFSEKAYLVHSDSGWEWGLAAQSNQARLFTQSRVEGVRVEARDIPIQPLLALAGEDWPLQGMLSISWGAGPSDKILFQVDSLSYANQRYPNFQLITEPGRDTLPFQIFWGNDPDQSLRGRGYYVLKDTLSPLFLRLTGNIPTGWIAPFVAEYLEGLEGYFRFSRLIVTGSLSNPDIIGDILLDRARAYIPFLRLAYTADGVVKCRGDTMWIVNLPMSDPNDRVAFLNGYVAFDTWALPYVALGVQIREGPVRLLATRPSSEAYLYGQALIDRGELSFIGPWNALQVTGFVRFAEGTDLTLPVENYLRTEKRSYVRFLGHQDTLYPDLKAPEGLSLQVSLLSAPTARFRVVFDSRTGDEIVASGISALLLRISPEGEVTISGSYEVTSGEYRLSLRGIVARTLRIEAGSRLMWDGDLYQGRLQMTATYRTFTSLRMIDSTYTATIPVEVRLLLGGTLLSPELRFQVEIPSLTGNPSPLITLFLQRLQNDEQERNRQVFALLAVGTFLPPEQGITSAQTTSGVSTTLPEFLSAQLSGLLGQIVGSQVGIGISMGQWNEISTQVRLSLGGRLTINREGVLIAPGQASPSLGNLSARYRVLPPRITNPTQLQLEAEAFNRQTFVGGSFGGSTQGIGLNLRKSFFLPPSRRKRATP